MMQERDRVRKKIEKSNESEWKELQGEYKRIRNEVIKENKTGHDHFQQRTDR